MPGPNEPEYFPELRFGTLQKHAQDWATFLKKNFDLPPLQNITLYNTPPFPFPFPERKYLILFEFPSLRKSDQTQRELFSMLRTYMHNPAYRPAMFRNFQEVYKEGKGPDGHAVDEWRFGDPLREWYFSYGMRIDLKPEPWLDSLDRVHCWILYTRALHEASKMSQEFRTVRGTYLYERWQISDIEFILFVIGECLRGNLRIYDAFDCEVSRKEIEGLWSPIEKSRNQIALYKNSREKALKVNVLELMIERAATWNEILPREEENYARLMTDFLDRLKKWRYAQEDIEALETKYPNLIPVEQKGDAYLSASRSMPETIDAAEKTSPDRSKIWASGHELVKRYRIRPSFKILHFVIDKKICPFDAKNLSPVLPPGAVGQLDDIRADIAFFEERNKVLEADRLKKRLADECIKQWELFASHCQRHEHSFRECGWLNDELNKQAIESLLEAIYDEAEIETSDFHQERVLESGTKQ
jgi:hypothetical protein